MHGEDIYECVRPFVNKANEEAGWRYDVRQIENIQFTKYGLNQHYDWHIDGDSDHWASRVLTPNKKEYTITKLPKNFDIENFYLNNSKLLNETKLKINLTNLEKDCKRISKIFFKK